MMHKHIQVFSSIALLLFTALSAAATSPLYSLIPIDGTNEQNVSLSSSGAVVQYGVTNNRNSVVSLTLQPQLGVSQTIKPTYCGNPMQLQPNQSCILSFTIDLSVANGNITSGPVLCDTAFRCSQPSAENSLKITSSGNLSTSLNAIALSVLGTGPLTGTPRYLTITNTGVSILNGITVSSTDLPPGTSIATTCSSSLPPSCSCTVTITPGTTASLDASARPCTTLGTIPINGAINVSADDGSQIKTNVLVLGYGCIYRSGYLFDIDDTPIPQNPIQGKVAALSDQASAGVNGVLWSSDNSGNPVFDNIGVADNSSSPCTGNTDGGCDSSTITSFYSAIPSSFYAAGRCLAIIGGYNNWYLPAICEMGYDEVNNTPNCGTQTSPTLQNMLNSLVANGIGGLNGIYWSSTEDSGQSGNAWGQNFTGVNQGQYVYGKQTLNGVRCVRAFVGT